MRDEGYYIETVIVKTPSGKRYATYQLRGDPVEQVVSGVASTSITEADSKPTEAAPETTTLFDMGRTTRSPYEDAA